jgi:hypothetical protein
MAGNNTDSRVQIGTAFPGMTFPDEIQNGSQLGGATYKEFQHLYAQLEGFLRAAGFNPDGTFNNLVAQSVTLVSNYNTSIPPGVGGPGTIYTVNAGGVATQISGGGGGVQCCPDIAGVGDLLFTSFGSEGDWKVYSPQGVDRGTLQSPVDNTASSIVALSTGVVVDVGGNSGTAFYPAALTAPTYPSDATTLQFGLGVDGSLNIYAFKSGGGTKVIRKVNSSGTLVTDYSLGSSTIGGSALVVNSSGSHIYYMAIDAFTAPLKTSKQVWVMETAGGTSSLFVSDGTYTLNQNRLLVLPTTGDLLVAWRGGGLTGRIDRYNSSGVLQQMYTPVYNGQGVAPDSITAGLTEGTFWLAAGANVNTDSGNVIMEIDVATGNIRNSFAPDDGTFYFGGPFCVLRAPIPYAYS